MKTSSSKGSLYRVIALSLAALAGYVVVFSAGPIAANKLINEIDPKNASLWVSVSAGSAALAAAISYVVFGRISTRLLRVHGSRQRIFIFSAIVILLAGLSLANASTVLAFIVSWVVTAIPAAALLSVATAIVLELVPKNRIGLASGLFGAGSVLALWIGAAINFVANYAERTVLMIVALLATALVVPASLLREKTELVVEPEAPKRAKLPKKFWRFIFGSSIAIGLSIVLTDYPFRIAIKLLHDPKTAGELVNLLSLSGSAAMLIGSLVGGALAITDSRSNLLFTWSLLPNALGVLLSLASSNLSLIVLGFVVSGLSTGVNIGSQLPVLKTILGAQATAGRESGIYNLFSVVPGILIPALAAVLITVNKAAWMPMLGVLLAVITVGATALARTIRIR